MGLYNGHSNMKLQCTVTEIINYSLEAYKNLGYTSFLVAQEGSQWLSNQE